MLYQRLILIILFNIIFPYFIFSKNYILDLNKENQSQFYLQNTVLSSKSGVSITLEKKKLQARSNKNLLFLNFSENQDLIYNNVSFIHENNSKSLRAVFYNRSSYIKLNYTGTFYTGIIIDFWLKPFSTEKGQIFSTENMSQDGLNHSLTIYLKHGKLYFTFRKLFQFYTTNTLQSVTLKSNSLINYQKWSHHKLIYNPETGKISYYLNDRINSEQWATSTSMPGGALLTLKFPKNSNFFLGKGFRGAIDDFYLSSNIDTKLSSSIYTSEPAYVHSRVIKLDEYSKINNIKINGYFPKYTTYKLEYRVNNTPFLDNTPESIIPWQKYHTNPKKNLLSQGHYVQLRIRLLSDPNFLKTPHISQILINYKELLKPVPPLDVAISSSSSKINISFTSRINHNIAAYKIYIGTKPGVYFGDLDNNIASPIIIPLTSLIKSTIPNRFSYTIDKVTPYKIYFLKLKSITTEGIESDDSQEVAIRATDEDIQN